MLIVVFVIMIVAGFMMVALTAKKLLGFLLMVVGFGGVGVTFAAFKAAAMKAGNKYAFVDFVIDCVCRLGGAS